MASSKLKSKYPHMAEYIDHHRHDPVQARIEAAMGKGCLFGGALVPVAAIGFGALGFLLFKHPIAAIGMGLLGGVTGTVLGGWLMQRMTKKAGQFTSSEEEMLKKAGEAARHFRKLDSDRKLHKWIDPVAAQLLEAGAFHWGRLNKALESQVWQNKETASHWSGLKERVENAANIAMAELVVLVSGCVGEPSKDRKEDLKEAFEDFAELDIADALQGLLKVSSRPATDYIFKSPRSREIFEPAKNIAHRLQQLADEMEQKTEELRIVSMDIPQEASSVDSIDVLLGEIRAVDQAEKELRQGH